MIIEKDYFDAEEVDIANAMNDKSRAPIRKIRLATTDSNKYYAKAILVGDQENILSGEIVFRPDSQVSWISTGIILVPFTVSTLYWTII